MKKAAILGGSLDQDKLVQEFKRLGFQTILFDYYEHPPAKETADKHYRVSTYDQEAVLEICRREKIDLIGTVSTDQPLVTAAYVAEQLGLAHPLSYRQACCLTHKAYMKEILAKSAIPTPRHLILESDSFHQGIENLTLPCVIKPVDSSGSRGVSFMTSHDQIKSCCSFALEQSRAKKVIIEEKIEGILVSVDAIVVDGKAEVLLIIDNAMFSDKLGLFRKMTYPSVIIPAAKEKIITVMQQIAEAFQLENTPLFVQFIVTGSGEVYVLELSARVAGGSKPYLIPRLSNVDLVSLYASQLLKEKISFKKQEKAGFYTCNYIWCDQKGKIREIEGAEQLLADQIIEHCGFYKKPGDYSEGRENGSNRIGFFYIAGETKEEIKTKTDLADQTLKIINQAGNDMMMHNIYD